MTGKGTRGGRGVGFEVSREGNFESLEGGKDGGSLDVLDCVGEMTCAQEEVE